MKKLLPLFSSLLVVLFIQGCSALYYGHSKEDWDRLTDDEQAAIKLEYQTIIDSKRAQAHQDVINARTQSIIDLGVSGANN